MMYAILLVILLTGITEGIPLIRRKHWKEFITVEILLGISVYLVVGKLLYIISPLDFLHKLVSPLGKALLK